MNQNNLITWAKNEVDLAIAPKNNDETSENNTNQYYKIAYKIFCKFVELTEKIDSSGVVKTILLQLLNNDPLTPIEEDNKEDWAVMDGYDGYTIFQCTRRNSLLKKVTYDRNTGEVEGIKYTDIDRYICMDINTETYYTGGIVSSILDEIIPITFPYMPTGKIKIFTETFKAFEEYDTIGILYIRNTDGRMIEVKRFFKQDIKTKEFIEIQFNEYKSRKKKAKDRKNA